MLYEHKEQLNEVITIHILGTNILEWLNNLSRLSYLASNSALWIYYLAGFKTSIPYLMLCWACFYDLLKSL